jgi:hypothetical protein
MAENVTLYGYTGINRPAVTTTNTTSLPLLLLLLLLLCDATGYRIPEIQILIDNNSMIQLYKCTLPYVPKEPYRL